MANKILSFENIENILKKLTAKIKEYVSETELEERLTDSDDATDIWNVVPSEDTGTGGSGDGTGGTSNYNSLYNLPKINGFTLYGSMVSSDIGVADLNHSHSYNALTDKPTIPTKLSELENDSDFVSDTDLSNKADLNHEHTIAEITNLQTTLESKADSEHSHSYNDLADKPTKLSQFENDEGLVTGNTLDLKLSSKANITYVDAELAKKANKTELHSHSNKAVLDGITSEKVSEWNNKSNFSGDYNELTNTPIIPTKVSELKNDSNYQTKTQVDEAIANVANGGSIDLSGYVTDTELTNALATKADRTHTHNEYISDIILDERINALNISSLATKEELTFGLTTKAEVEHSHEEYITNTELDERIGNIDLSELATKEELATKADLEHTHAISEITNLQTTLDAKALKTELHSHDNKSVLDGITSTKVDEWDNKSEFSGSYNDLTDTPSIPTNVSELNNDKAYQTKSDVDTAIANAVTGGTIDLSGYTTDDELSEGLATKADLVHTHSQYLTEHQDISGLATKEELITKMELADKQNMFLYSSGATGVPTLATSFVYYRGYVYVNSGHTTTNEVTSEEEKVLRIRSQSSARTGAYFQPMEFSYTDFVHGIPYTLSFEYRVPSTSTFDVNTFKLIWEDCMYDCTDDCVQTIFNVVDLEVINEENGWKRVTCTHTFSEAHPSGGFWFEMDTNGNSSTCDIYLRNFKLEKGAEATPYAISADEQLLNKIEDVDDKTIYASEVSGIEDFISYYAKEDILPETFKSMFVGGNNLIDDPENRIMDIGTAYTVTANQTVDEWGTGNAFHVTGTTPSNILTIGYIHTKADESDYQKVGTLYASSMYIKNNGTTTLSIYFNGGGELEGFPREAQVNAGECKRIWVAGVGSSGSKLCFVIDNKSTSSAVDFYYWRPIIQEGSIPSPWELANLALTTTADVDVIWNES